MKPVAVTMRFSEAGSDMGRPNRRWDFKAFEEQAFAVARRHPGPTYLKTDVVVHMDDGSTIQMRCDLGADSDHGVWSVVAHYKRFLKTEEGKRYYAESTEGGKSFFDAVNSVELP